MGWLKRLLESFRNWWNDPGPELPDERMDEEQGRAPFDPADDWSDRA
ncbi:MAG TPA: hypothetical protein VMT59_05015 [Gaiellaceae bacterium]|nr:hypothetical protein [Gaiellaceae bacterium]